MLDRLKEVLRSNVNIFDSCSKCGNQGGLFLTNGEKLTKYNFKRENVICKKCIEKFGISEEENVPNHKKV